jgi:hypothetical protein
MTHPNSIMKDFGKAFSSPKKRKALSVEQIAEKILAFDPGNADFVAVGVKTPMEPSATNLTWNDIRALALAKGKQPKKRVNGHLNNYIIKGVS